MTRYGLSAASQLDYGLPGTGCAGLTSGNTLLVNYHVALVTFYSLFHPDLSTKLTHSSSYVFIEMSDVKLNIFYSDLYQPLRVKIHNTFI